MKSSVALTLLVALSASACDPAGHVQPANPETFCKIAKPIYFDPADRMTERTERAIIAHNEKGAALCRWQGAQ